MATCGRGDQVIVIAPYWVSYIEQAKLAGATPVVVHTTAEQGYKVTPAQLTEAITAESRLLILCNPSNPTGALYTKEALEEIAEVWLEMLTVEMTVTETCTISRIFTSGLDQVVKAHPRLLVLADEIYDELLYDGAPVLLSHCTCELSLPIHTYCAPALLEPP